jgi:hypothetical protein
MAISDTVTSYGSSLLGGVFDATGAATQAGLQGVVNTGVSQTIGTYNQAVRQGLGMAMSQGTNSIMNSIGVNLQNIPYVGGILQNVVQSGLYSAATVFEHIIDGNLTLNNLPGFGNYNVNKILSNDPGITGSIASGMNGLTNTLTSLTSGSLNNLGVPNFVSNAVLGALGPGQGQGLGAIGTNAAAGSSIVSEKSYASVLDYGKANYTPKFKFLYIVNIQFVDEYKTINNSFTFLIKKFERPTITIEHDEVNFYNFRSMVPKRTVYKPFNFEIHDDIQSEAMKFVVGYLRKVSPIFNTTNADSYESNSMNYLRASSSYGLQTRHDNFNVINTITVSHLYNFNATMDVYTFHKPKILEVTLGDWDMSAGTEGSSININMAYDGFDVQVGVKAKVPGQPLGLLDLMENQHPVDLGTNDSKGGVFESKPIKDLTYLDSASPNQSGNNSFRIISEGTRFVAPGTNIPQITDAKFMPAASGIIPGNVIDAGLANAQVATMSTSANNIINNTNYISSTSPKIMPSLSEMAAGAVIPTSAPKASANSFMRDMQDVGAMNYG